MPLPYTEEDIPPGGYSEKLPHEDVPPGGYVDDVPPGGYDKKTNLGAKAMDVLANLAPIPGVSALGSLANAPDYLSPVLKKSNQIIGGGASKAIQAILPDESNDSLFQQGIRKAGASAVTELIGAYKGFTGLNPELSQEAIASLRQNQISPEVADIAGQAIGGIAAFATLSGITRAPQLGAFVASKFPAFSLAGRAASGASVFGLIGGATAGIHEAIKQAQDGNMSATELGRKILKSGLSSAAFGSVLGFDNGLARLVGTGAVASALTYAETKDPWAAMRDGAIATGTLALMNNDITAAYRRGAYAGARENFGESAKNASLAKGYIPDEAQAIKEKAQYWFDNAVREMGGAEASPISSYRKLMRDARLWFDQNIRFSPDVTVDTGVNAGEITARPIEPMAPAQRPPIAPPPIPGGSAPLQPQPQTAIATAPPASSAPPGQAMPLPSQIAPPTPPESGAGGPEVIYIAPKPTEITGPSLEMINQDPDFVNLRNDSEAIYRKYATKFGLDMSEESKKRIYSDLHDLINLVRIAPPESKASIKAQLDAKYPDLGREWQTVMLGSWAEKDPQSVFKLVNKAYSKKRPLVGLENDAKTAEIERQAIKIAQSMRREAEDTYNSEIETYERWRGILAVKGATFHNRKTGKSVELRSMGIAPPKKQGSGVDLMGEWKINIPLYLKKRDGRPLDEVISDAMAEGLIRDEKDIFDAISKLRAPARPGPVESYLPEARRIAEYENRPEEQGGGEFASAFESSAPYGSKNKPIFYSKLQSVIEQKLPNSAPVSMVRSIIDPAKGDVKAEEVEWSGIDEFLSGKEKVSKAELLDFLKQNQVEVKEVEKRELTTDVEFNALAEKRRNGTATPEENARYNEMASLIFSRGRHPGDTKYSVHQLPGGSNYREVLLTLPDSRDLPSNFKVEKHPEYGWMVTNTDIIGPGSVVQGISREEAVANARKFWKNKTDISFRSSHFDEPNILAHVRMNDRTTEDGKNILFLEEVQSDWMQKGREVGFIGDKPKYESLPEEYTVRSRKEAEATGDTGNVTRYWVENVDGKRLTAYHYSRESATNEAINNLNDQDRGTTASPVPNAPFKKTWHELALKRMLRYAVDNGYDGIAWTTGEQQAERYDLSKQVDSIAYIKTKNGYEIQAIKKSVGPVIHREDVKESDLAELVGKDLAKKIISGGGNETDEWTSDGVKAKEFSGLDLKVGGEGMKGFYDQMLPSFLNKYTKKWGGRVGESKIDVNGKQKLVHSLEITPSMRESVSQGQPLFENKGKYGDQTQTPEFKRWFGDSVVTDNGKPMSEGGKPLIVYHGTWQPGFSSFKGASYFSASEIYASKFSGYDVGEKGAIYPVFLSIENPIDLTNFGEKKIGWKSFVRAIENKGLNFPIELKEVARGIVSGPAWEYMRAISDLAPDFMRNNGFDGVVQVEDKKRVFIALSKSQIKSAIGNIGTFDPNNPSILKEQGDMFGATKENISDTFERLVSRARVQGMSMPDAIKYAKRTMAASQKPIEITPSPQQQQFGDAGGVQGFGDGRKGEKDLFAMEGKSPYGLEYNIIKQAPFEVEYKKTGSFQFPNKYITGPEDIAFAFRELKGNRREHIFIVGVKNGVAKYVELLSIGAIDRAQFSNYELGGLLLSSGSDGFYIVHHHPSGDPTPSHEDYAILNKSADAYLPMGIKLKGGVIINDKEFSWISPEDAQRSGHKKMAYPGIANQDSVSVDQLTAWNEWNGNKTDGNAVAGPEDIFAVTKGSQIGKNSMLVSFMNTKNRIMGMATMPSGALKTLFHLSTKLNANRVAISFDENPILSEVHQIQKHLDKLGVELLDVIANHVGGGYTSFLETRKISPIKQQNAMAESQFTYGKKQIVPDKIYQQAVASAKSKKSTFLTIKDLMSDFKDVVEGAIRPISSELASMNPYFKKAIRRHAFAILKNTQDDLAAAMPLIRHIKSLDPDDYRVFDLAAKNGDIAVLDNIMARRSGMRQAYDTYRVMMNKARIRAEGTGFDIGYLTDYFPRVISDRKAYMEMIKLDPRWPEISKMLATLGSISESEIVSAINSFLRGYTNGQLAFPRTGNMKRRELEIIDASRNMVYMTVENGIIKYIRDINKLIADRQFFGKTKMDKTELPLFASNSGREERVQDKDIDTSIGEYVLRAIQSGKLKEGGEKKLKAILDAYFKPLYMSQSLATFRDLTYINTLGNIISALTQLKDLGASIYYAPKETFKSFVKSLSGNSYIKIDDLGLEDISDEFAQNSRLRNWVGRALFAGGIQYLDRITAETNINAQIAKYQKLAKNPTADFNRRLDVFFGPEKAQVVEDLKEGTKTTDVLFLAMNELFEKQPKGPSETPRGYLKGGNARWFYQLKMFGLRQLDWQRNEIMFQMSQPGIANKSKGILRLSYLIFALVAVGATDDQIKDFILGRTASLKDRIIDNLLQLTGIVNKWTIYKAKEEGLGTAIMKNLLPPMPILDHLWKDIRTAGDGRGLSLAQDIPLVGKAYYWRFGQGAKKMQEKRAKMRSRQIVERRPSKRKQIQRQQMVRR